MCVSVCMGIRGICNICSFFLFLWPKCQFDYKFLLPLLSSFSSTPSIENKGSLGCLAACDGCIRGEGRGGWRDVGG